MLLLEATTSLVNIISNVGFPIACVIGMGWYMRETQSENRKAFEEDKERYEALANRALEVITESTRAMQELTTLLETHINDFKTEIGKKGV